MEAVHKPLYQTTGDIRHREGVVLNEAVFQKLVQVAKAKSTIQFVELGKVADMVLDNDEDIAALGHILDAIAEQDVAAGRPLLPALVVHGNRNMPGVGFFRFAKKKKLQKSDDLTFFASELKRVYDYWAHSE
jgi:hypothetical protein